MRTKVLCTGGESTGTRLAQRLLADMGADAIHRSFPHGGEWPDLNTIDFDAAVVMARLWVPTTKSQVRAGHVAARYVAYANLWEAYPRILSGIGSKPWVLITFEGLYQYPGLAIQSILDTIPGLHWPENALDIRDENRKWITR